MLVDGEGVRARVRARASLDQGKGGRRQRGASGVGAAITHKLGKCLWGARSLVRGGRVIRGEGTYARVSLEK